MTGRATRNAREGVPPTAGRNQGGRGAEAPIQSGAPTTPDPDGTRLAAPGKSRAIGAQPPIRIRGTERAEMHCTLPPTHLAMHSELVQRMQRMGATGPARAGSRGWGDLRTQEADRGMDPRTGGGGGRGGDRPPVGGERPTRHAARPSAALTSFTIGGTTLLILCLGLRLPLPSREQWTAPWWVWTGGLLGAAFVTAQATLPTRLGVTAFVVLVVAGQLLIALVMDQFGWLDLQVRPVTVQKLIGVVLLVAAVVLIRM